MSGSFIPDDIAHFIAEKIDSIAQLEALLLLRDNPERQWSVRALAARLYVDEEQTARLLTEICKQSLVMVSLASRLFTTVSAEFNSTATNDRQSR